MLFNSKPNDSSIQVHTKLFEIFCKLSTAVNETVNCEVVVWADSNDYQVMALLLDDDDVPVCVFIDSICFCQNATTCPVGRQPFTEILVHATRKGPVLKRVSTIYGIFISSQNLQYDTQSMKSLNNLYTIMIFFDTNILTIIIKLK